MSLRGNPRIHLLAAGVVMLLLTGCFRFQIVDEPGARGRITDAATGKPIGKAEVCELKQVYTGKPVDDTQAVRCVSSDTAGEFEIATLTHPQWMFFMVEMFPPRGQFLVTADGYQTQVIYGAYKQSVPVSLQAGPSAADFLRPAPQPDRSIATPTPTIGTSPPPPGPSTAPP